MKYFVQRGHNPDWPYLIPEHNTWRLGEDIPEWLSDRAYITIISGDGIKNLGTRETSGGGIEIINSGKIGTLVTLKKKDWIVIYKDGVVKSLSPEAMKFLYKKKELK
jgi:hypothetical protein